MSFDVFILIVQASATIILAYLTWTLARHTKRLADAASAPMIVASLEVNETSHIFIDLVVENTGNATAFDVAVKFTPPLPIKEGRQTVPYQSISVMRPGQKFASFVNRYNDLSSTAFKVEISWAEKPLMSRKYIEYDFDLSHFNGASFLGNRSPLQQIAKELEAIQTLMKPILQGSRRIQSDVFTEEERQAESEALEALSQEWLREQKSDD